MKGCDLVLSYNGIPTSKHTLPRAIEKLARLAGVHRIKIHALRHSHASMLIELDFTPLEIADHLGHESVKATLDTYSHLYPDKNQKLADRLNQFRRMPSARRKKALETSGGLWYIEHKEGHLLVTGAPQDYR